MVEVFLTETDHVSGCEGAGDMFVLGSAGVNDLQESSAKHQDVI